MTGGLQFSFYLTTGDLKAFEANLRTSGDILFLKSYGDSKVPEQTPDSIVRVMGQEPLKILIARGEDIEKIELAPTGIIDEYSYDAFADPIIEFSRCYVTDRFIRAGRLYRVDKYWDENQQLVSKPKAFIDWADRLYKLAKASLTKVEQGCHAGAEALELRKKGVAFEGLDIEVGSIKD